MACIFCSIAKKESPADILYEDDALMAFTDRMPKAPVHILIIPKRHIASLNDVKEDHCDLLGKLFFRAKELARQMHIAESEYKVIINTGHDGGQVIDHLHIHLLGGKFLREV